MSSASSYSSNKRNFTPSLSNKIQKRSSLFTAITKLESEDVRATKVRRLSHKKNAVKSVAARSQAHLYGELVECRIVLQKSLAHNYWEQSPEENEDQPMDGNQSDDNDGTIRKNDVEQKCKSYLDKLLANLLEARKKLDPFSLDPVKNHDSSKDKYNKLVAQWRESHELEVSLQREYDKVRSSWKEILNRRHSEMNLQLGRSKKVGSKFRVLDQSFWNQIESTASHDRLMQRQRHQKKSESNGNKKSTIFFRRFKIVSTYSKRFHITKYSSKCSD